jgi:hypothetical protein
MYLMAKIVLNYAKIDRFRVKLAFWLFYAFLLAKRQKVY